MKLFNRFGDLLVLARGLWFILLLDALAAFAFLGTTQGPDILLCLIEDLTYSDPQRGYLWHWSPLLFLLLAILYWSMSAEVAARWYIYLSDNGGRNLAPERVESRKRLQKRAVRALLWFPVVLMAVAFARAISKRAVTLELYQWWGVALAYAGLLVVAIILYLLFAYKKGVKWYCYQPFSWFCPSRIERTWSVKLLGIYNDLRIDLSGPAPAGTTGPYLPAGIRLPNGVVLPRADQTPAPAPTVQPENPSAFQLLPGYPVTQKGGNQVWMYRVPRLFYRQLLNQLHFFAAAGALLILLGALLSVNAFFMVGTAAIICFAFGAWAVVSVYIRYLDKIKTRWRVPVPVRLVLMGLFFISTCWNNDHVVRTLPEGEATAYDPRQPVDTHSYRAWLRTLAADPKAYRIAGTGTAIPDTLPVVFITAEGGALRTGAFTALTLAHLLEQYPDLPRNVYGYSTVSGGTVGANFFNALTQHAAATGRSADSCLVQTKKFFGNDYLSAILARMLTGEIINYFWPRHIGRFDRAIALEKGWEKGWRDMFPDEDDALNLLHQPFNRQLAPGLPALFINTTEAETGLQCLWSNRDIASLPCASSRDLLRRSWTPLRYSTAIGLSARFPLISPAAAFFWGPDTARILRHFVDGGYYENKGTETMLQVMEALEVAHPLIVWDKKPLWVKPYLLQFNFGDPGDPNDNEDSSNIKPVRSFNEISEVIAAIYNTRNGRGLVQQLHLNTYLKRSGGVLVPFDLPLDQRKVPMNWIMSNAALNTLDGWADSLARSRSAAVLRTWKPAAASR